MRLDYGKHGDTRRREGFLFLPKSIKGDFRWLEYAVWEEECVCNWVDGCTWIKLQWIEK